MAGDYAANEAEMNLKLNLVARHFQNPAEMGKQEGISSDRRIAPGIPAGLSLSAEKRFREEVPPRPVDGANYAAPRTRRVPG